MTTNPSRHSVEDQSFFDDPHHLKALVHTQYKYAEANLAYAEKQYRNALKEFEGMKESYEQVCAEVSNVERAKGRESR